MSRLPLVLVAAVVLLLACATDDSATPEQEAILDELGWYEPWFLSVLIPPQDVIADLIGAEPRMSVGAGGGSVDWLMVRFASMDFEAGAEAPVRGFARVRIGRHATTEDARVAYLFDRPEDIRWLATGSAQATDAEMLDGWIADSTPFGGPTGAFVLGQQDFRVFGATREGATEALLFAAREHAREVLGDRDELDPPPFPRDLSGLRERLVWLRAAVEGFTSYDQAQHAEVMRRCEDWRAEGDGEWRLLAHICFDMPPSAVPSGTVLVLIDHALRVVDRAIAVVE